MNRPTDISHLIRAHDAGLRLLVRRLLQDEHQVEDVLQDTWMAAHHTPPGVPGGVQALRWLRRVARNFALRRRRSDSRRLRHEVRAGVPDLVPSCSEILEREDVRHAVVEAVRSLEEPYRAVILYRYFEDLPRRLIAQRLDISVAAVKTRLARGLQQLRARFDHRFDGDRHAWQAALLPLVGGTLHFGLGGAATAATSSSLPGAILMTLKSKWIAISLLALLVGGVGGIILILDSDRNEEPAPRSPDPARMARSTTPFERAPQEAGTQEDRKGPSRSTIEPASEPSSMESTRQPALVGTGRVLDDRDGRSITGGRVRLGRGSWHQPDMPSATSDAAGVFQIPIDVNRQASVLTVFVEASGYAPHRFVVPIEPKAPVAPGTVNLGDLRINLGARIEGRVVRGDNGNPVIGALLLWTDRGPNDEGFLAEEARDAGRSGSGGRFVLRDRLPPIQCWGHTLYAFSPEGSGWTTIHVVKNRESLGGIEIRVHPPGRASVAVRDGNGTPVSGVHVTAEPQFVPVRQDRLRHTLSPRVHADLAAMLVSTTDVEGLAHFDCLPAAQSPVTYDFVARDETGRIGFRDGVQIRGEKEAHVTIAIDDPRGTLSGIVRNRAGVPVAGATVRSPADDRATTTDAEGGFRLDGLCTLTGEIRIEVSASDYASLIQRFAVTPGANVQGIEFVLDRKVRIDGWVVDQHGMPIAGAGVVLVRQSSFDPPGSAEMPISAAPTSWSAVTADRGGFAFPDATGGRWSLQVSPPEPATDWESSHVRTVEGGERAITVVLTRLPTTSAKVIATVVHARTGEVLDPVQVRFSRVQRGSHVSGEGYALPRPVLAVGCVTADVKPGRWRLQVRVAGVGVGEHEFVVRETDTECAFEILVGEPGTIVAHVVQDESMRGGRLPDFILVNTEPPGLGQWAVESGREETRYSAGFAMVRPAHSTTFRLENVPSGMSISLRLVLPLTSGLLGSARVVVPPGGEVDVDIPVRQGGVLAFRSASTWPIGNGRILISTDDGSTWKEHGLAQRSAGPLSCDLVVPPGKILWRLEYLQGWTSSGQPRWGRAEGVADATAGKATVVEVTLR